MKKVMEILKAEQAKAHKNLETAQKALDAAQEIEFNLRKASFEAVKAGDWDKNDRLQSEIIHAEVESEDAYRKREYACGAAHAIDWVIEQIAWETRVYPEYDPF